MLAIYFGNDDSNYHHFETLSKVVEDMFFGHVFDKEISKLYGIEDNEARVVLFKKKGDELRNDYKGEFKLEDMERFVKSKY